MEVKLESNRKTYLNAKYVNPAKNRDIHVNVDTIPDTKILHFVITNGARKHDLSIKYNDNYKFWEQGTFFEIDGTSLGETVSGKMSGSKNGDVNVVQMEFEKGNKKFTQIDTKIKKDSAAMSFEARTKYAILGGKIAGKVLIKLANNVLTLKNTDGGSNDSIELIVKVALGESLHIEGKKMESPCGHMTPSVPPSVRVMCLS
eukprot:TRINITY_DN2106_c0_g1_i2.p1 TRINITY_DN2106_c0_g1~~TRINITY_DN2106_c0_g1_i2.p1  ORF type:complete len:235 (-),score=65.03 TRINITY_DN2106_c0_g1_i2:70-675(-)